MAWGLPAGDEPGLVVHLARAAADLTVEPITTRTSLQGRCLPVGPESASGDDMPEGAASDRAWETVGDWTSSAQENGWAAPDSAPLRQGTAFSGWLGALAVLGGMAWPEGARRSPASGRPSGLDEGMGPRLGKPGRTARENRPT
jgi:hypothetical protein